MTYKTLVANSASQQRWSFDSSAETLLDLKQEFRSRNIPFEGLSITEGLCTKAELTRDDAVIPVSERTVNYGGESYSRVFLITNTKKNIASGCDDEVTLTNRSEAYRIIKEKGLQEEIKIAFGRNFTQVPTAALWDFINNNEDEEDLFDDETEKSEMDNDSNDGVADIVEDIVDMIGTMVEDGYLDADDLEDMLEMLEEMKDGIKISEAPTANPVATTDGVITNDDVDKMLADLS